ncbi:MAG TPA: hypothetical protein VHA78_00750 [Candidatus Peribacteraceae bacterium]|nr:hypothetical protein [Candidatus Peribacteraceae bacterium]
MPLQIRPILSSLRHQNPSAPTLVAAAVTVPTIQSSEGSTALLPIVAQADIHPDQQTLANDVLERLPSLCRDNLKNFYVLYQGATQRGLGGKTTIIIDGHAVGNEFVGLMVHECGHVIHGNLLGDITSGASNFTDGNDVFAKDSPAAAFFSISWSTPNVMKAGLTKKDFVSGYAQTNCFEDFAETFTGYVLERPWMETRAKSDPIIAAKLQWMEANLPLPANLLGTGTEQWTGTVPWDATKLAYVWSPISLN